MCFIIRRAGQPRKKRGRRRIVFTPVRVCYNTRMENLDPIKTELEPGETSGAVPRARWKKTVGMILIGIALCVMLWQLVTILLTGMRHVTHGLLLIAGICLPLMLGTYLYTRSQADRKDRRNAVRFSFFALFVFYCAVLLGALILSRVDFQTFAATKAEYWNNLDLNTNFNPLETVRLYINAIKYDYIGMEIPLSNLVGNAMLFMPMAVFLPCLFRPMQRLWLFTLAMFLLLVAVEVLQLLLACGSCDVDDVLLNLAGTLILFGILKIPFLQRLLRRLYLLPEPAARQPEEALESDTPDATA